MKSYEIVIATERGDVKATTGAANDVPIQLVLSAVMQHQQLAPHLVKLGINEAHTVLITQHRRLELPPGFTIVFANGVNINGPLVPSPIYGIPPEFGGRDLTNGLAVLVTYKVEIE